jgi:hypothetical protein
VTHVGTIGILTTEHGRYSRFWLTMLAAAMPPRTKLIVKMSLNIAEARNEILREADGEWVWFMDDDHTFAPDLLRNLLARDVDIIQPLVLTRYAPFAPVMMGPETPDGKNNYRLALTPQLATGLEEVEIVGCAGMLIKRRVWEALRYPYFTSGSLAPDVLSEDFAFCRAARAAGFRVFTDLDNRMGHLNVGEVWPERLPDGTWGTKLIFGNEAILLPAAAPKMTLDVKTGALTHVDGRRERLRGEAAQAPLETGPAPGSSPAPDCGSGSLPGPHRAGVHPVTG